MTIRTNPLLWLAYGLIGGYILIPHCQASTYAVCAFVGIAGISEIYRVIKEGKPTT